MFTLRKFFLSLVLLGAHPVGAHAESWHQTYWNPGTGQRLTEPDARHILEGADALVLGEEHYNLAVQQAEAGILRLLASSQAKKGELVFGWEFLNTEDAPRIQASYESFLNDQIKTEEFLQALFPNGTTPMEYAPVMEASRDVRAKLIPTNLSRAQKNPVTRGGIEALDPALLPEDFQIGGAEYLERFREAMGDHHLPYPLENYFEAQSLTDEVMAAELLKAHTDAQRVLIVGSFHGDYRDGVVKSLERRRPGMNILYVRIVDASAMTETELKEIFVHPKYGVLADLVLIVNEPLSKKTRNPTPLRRSGQQSQSWLNLL